MVVISQQDVCLLLAQKGCLNRGRILQPSLPQISWPSLKLTQPSPTRVWCWADAVECSRRVTRLIAARQVAPSASNSG